ncbi:bifunctional histidinol-phosphatase/imidazoleglycerol-phosphate dehydratase HisB [Frateuria aurantia]|uniref:Histidine biosynthesis bifunctional protein HisB n=1 Tax=Frateuria aurantia (strain ATCC 33424 / DSM 6220 / KCTC 2777 / LMG 1558 / NBRC 3245 / NCIMB 13370) TaxID=767434 RepID=H8KYS4_FRAAD|nr:bifunctional histidinol-phosphatase/imidazoleglycerol-phosphate dehydratase HisB [Frateuria aurantia]AFC86145.1 histidinol-phosphatase [Frateuria aurantia DSM 6220]
MSAKILFVDRDGCLIEEPADEQIDSYAKFRLMPGVIAALQRCVGAGYRLVMVTNQDGLGTDAFPEADFVGPQALLLQILESQGICFDEILIDRSFPHEARDTRKPGVGLLRHYLADDGWSRAASAVIGDRESDMQLAANLGVRGLRVGTDGLGWAEIAHLLLDAPRIATVVRDTKETRIRVKVDLDRVADPVVHTGLGFFDHMLEQIGKHGGFALDLQCDGDIHVDPHHTIEDCGLALGQALRQALGDRRGIARYGFSLPMDEAAADARLDLSGRPYLVFEGTIPAERVGDLPVEMIPHFFRSLCETLGANLHLNLRGDNAHHMIEAAFKVTARTLRQAMARTGNDLPSTKGVLA